MKRIAVVLSISLLAAGCQEDLGDVNSSLAEHDAVHEKWRAQAGAAEEGDAQAIAALDAAFASTKNEYEKEHLALRLAETPKADPKYRQYTVALAKQVVDEDAPFPMRIYPWANEPSDSFTGEFKTWCKDRKIALGACVERLLVTYPTRMIYLDERDTALLVRALQVRNFAVAESAAEMLSDRKHIETVPQLVAAAKRLPQPYRMGVVQALADFDTPATWKHVETLVGDPDLVAFLRSEVARDADEAREHAAAKP